MPALRQSLRALLSKPASIRQCSQITATLTLAALTRCGPTNRRASYRRRGLCGDGSAGSRAAFPIQRRAGRAASVSPLPSAAQLPRWASDGSHAPTARNHRQAGEATYEDAFEALVAEVIALRAREAGVVVPEGTCVWLTCSDCVLTFLLNALQAR